MNEDRNLEIVRGIPLSQEPSLGALTLPGFLREIVDRHGTREALVMPYPDRPTERWSARQWAQLEAEPGWDEADLSSFRYLDRERNLRRPQKSIDTSYMEPRATYWSTETFTISTAYAVTVSRDVWEGSNGEVLPGNTIKIVDPETGRSLRHGETGEIAVKGPTLMLGYVGVLADEAFDEGGFYHAGDGGYFDDRGRLIFQGRINDIIKTGGANVSPAEVDWVLGSCPGVKICKTIGVPHNTLGEIVVSCIVPEHGRELAYDAVLGYLKARLASYKLPRKILFVTEAGLNLTGTAKVKPAEARACATKKLTEMQNAANEAWSSSP